MTVFSMRKSVPPRFCVGGAEIEANTLFRIERIKMTASLGLHPGASFAIELHHRARDYAANSERDETQERLC